MKGYNVVVKRDLKNTLKMIAVKKEITIQKLVDTIIREWLEEEDDQL